MQEHIKELYAPMGNIGIFADIDPHREYVYMKKRKEGLELLALQKSSQAPDPMKNLEMRFSKYSKRIFNSARDVALDRKEFSFAYVLYMNAWFSRESIAIERLTSALYQFEVLSFIGIMKNSKFISDDQRMKKLFSLYVSKENYAWGVIANGTAIPDVISSLDAENDPEFMSMFSSFPIEVRAKTRPGGEQDPAGSGEEINFSELMFRVRAMKRQDQFDFGLDGDLGRLEMYTGIPDKWRLDYPDEIKNLMLKATHIKTVYEKFKKYVARHPEFYSSMVDISDLLNRNMYKILSIVRTCRKRNLGIIYNLLCIANDNTKARFAGMNSRDINAERVRIVTEGMEKLRREIVKSANSLHSMFARKRATDSELITQKSSEERMGMFDLKDTDEMADRAKDPHASEQKRKKDTPRKEPSGSKAGPIYSYWDDSPPEHDPSDSESSDDGKDTERYELNRAHKVTDKEGAFPDEEEEEERPNIRFINEAANIQEVDMEVARQSIGIIMASAKETSDSNTQAMLSSSRNTDRAENEEEEGEKSKGSKRKMVNIGASSKTAMIVAADRQFDAMRQTKKTRTSNGYVDSMMCEQIYNESKSMISMASSPARNCRITVDMVWMCIIYENLSDLYETEVGNSAMYIGVRMDHVSRSMHATTARKTIDMLWSRMPIRLDGVWDRFKVFGDTLLSTIARIKGKNTGFDMLIETVNNTPNVNFSTKKILQSDILNAIVCPVTKIEHRPGFIVSKTETGFVEISVHLTGEQPLMTMLCALPVAAFVQYMRTILNMKTYVINVLQAEYVNYVLRCNDRVEKTNSRSSANSTPGKKKDKKQGTELIQPSMSGMISAYMDVKNDELHSVLSKLIESLNKMSDFCFQFVSLVQTNV